MSPKYKQETLWVKAKGVVREIATDTGLPLRNMRFVGRDINFNVFPEGVVVGYHSFYIKQLKDGALIPMDLKTATLAGVSFTISKEQ